MRSHTVDFSAIQRFQLYPTIFAERMINILIFTYLLMIIFIILSDLIITNELYKNNCDHLHSILNSKPTLMFLKK